MLSEQWFKSEARSIGAVPISELSSFDAISAARPVAQRPESSQVKIRLVDLKAKKIRMESRSWGTDSQQSLYDVAVHGEAGHERQEIYNLKATISSASSGAKLNV